MLTVEFPSGSSFHFDTPEALARAVQSIRAGTLIVVRSEKDGSREVRVGARGRGLTGLETPETPFGASGNSLPILRVWPCRMVRAWSLAATERTVQRAFIGRC